MLSFFPRDVLDEILNLLESVSEDFPSYSCNRNNIRGEIIENFITNILCLMNDKSNTLNTYLHPATGTFSSLDLSLCHPSLLLEFDWMLLLLHCCFTSTVNI